MRFTTILAFTALFVYAHTQTNEVIVKDLKLFVNSKEFFIKAVAYNPVPLGYASMKSDQTGGAGYCSPLQTMWTEWKSACYDSDYFSTTTGAPGASAPGNGWFTNLWQRDFPIMKAMGTNTLRIYNTNPSTSAATTMYSNIFLTPYGKSHIGFMDYADQFGFKVVFPLIGDHTLMVNTPTAVFKRYIMWQIDEIGNHPALLMYTVGNELNFDSDPTLVPLVNKYVGFARSYQKLRWNRRIPITSAVVDLPDSYDMLAATLDVDIFTTNAGYRGISFTDLWAGNTVTKGWWTLSCQFNKPVFIGEIGWHDIDNSIMKSIPNWFNQIWLDNIRHINQGCIGGTFFEYSDELYSKADRYQQTMGVVSFQENVQDGKSSLQQFSFNPDTVVLKQIYGYVSNGSTPDGTAANFNTDIFAFIGRAPYTLSTLPSADICAANFTLKACPTKNSYDCSANGICDRFAGTCSCGVGWTGSDCSVGVCTESATCSGKGDCVTTLSPPFCACDDGSDGADCSTPTTANACPIGPGWSTACSNGNGICSNSTWTCACHQGWNGPACSVPTGIFVSVSSSSTVVSSTSSASQASTSIQSSSTTGAQSSSVQSSSTGSDRSSSSTASVLSSTGSVQSTTGTQSSTTSTPSTSTVSVGTSTTGSGSSSTSGSVSTSSVQASSTVSVQSSSTAVSSSGPAQASTSGRSTSTTRSISSSGNTQSSSTSGSVQFSSTGSVQSSSTTSALSSFTGASTGGPQSSTTGSVTSTTLTVSTFTTGSVSTTGSVESSSTGSVESSSTGSTQSSSSTTNPSSTGSTPTTSTASSQSSTTQSSSSTGSVQASTSGNDQSSSSTTSNPSSTGIESSTTTGSAASSTTGVASSTTSVASSTTGSVESSTASSLFTGSVASLSTGSDSLSSVSTTATQISSTASAQSSTAASSGTTSLAFNSAVHVAPTFGVLLLFAAGLLM